MAKRSLIVDSGNHDRVHCPVSAVVDAADVSDPKRLALSLAGADTPCQAEVEGDQVKVSWLIRKLARANRKSST